MFRHFVKGNPYLQKSFFIDSFFSCILVGLHERVVKLLEKNRNNHEFHKEYIALVHGVIEPRKARGCITYPLVKRHSQAGGDDGTAYASRKAAFEVKVCRPCYDALRASGGKSICGGMVPVDMTAGAGADSKAGSKTTTTPADGSTGQTSGSPADVKAGLKALALGYKKGSGRENPDCPLSKDPSGWKCQAGQVAKTFYQAIGYYNGVDADGNQVSYTLVGVKIISGQTHQIRVHLKEFSEWECGINSGRAGIVGDSKYMPKWASDADRKAGFSSHFLHAFKLGVPRIADSLNQTGRKGKRDNFLAPLPQAQLKVMEQKLFWDANLNDELSKSELKPNFGVSEENIPTFLKGHRDFQMNWDWTTKGECKVY